MVIKSSVEEVVHVSAVSLAGGVMTVYTKKRIAEISSDDKNLLLIAG
jgi:hypothetical protein